MTAIVQQAVSTFDNFKAGFPEQITNHNWGVDGFPDVFLELQFAVFVYPDFEIDLLFFRSGHLEPNTDSFAEVHLKGLTGGDFIFVEDVEDEIAAGGQIGVDIVEDLRHIGNHWKRCAYRSTHSR